VAIVTGSTIVFAEIAYEPVGTFDRVATTVSVVASSWLPSR
jgi:hypothetical protein